MKRIVLSVFIILFSGLFNKGHCALTITPNGGTTVSTNLITQGLTVNYTTLVDVTYTMYAMAQNQYITSTANPSIQIPISRLYLNDGTTSFQMVYNTDVMIINNLAIVGGFTKNFTAQITPIGPIPPGTYTTTLRFRDTTLFPNTVTYTLTFTIPLNQSVAASINPVNITLTSDNVFDTTSSFTNTTSPQVNLQSNSNWKLILDTTSLGTLNGNYYYQITNATSHVTTYSSAVTALTAGTQTQIASGTPTVTDPLNGTYATDYITIQYSKKNTSGSYTPQGSYNNYVTYTIQQN